MEQDLSLLYVDADGRLCIHIRLMFSDVVLADSFIYVETDEIWPED